MPRHSAPLQPAWIRPRLVVTLAVAAAGLATAIWLPTRNDSADASEWRRNIPTIASQEQFSDDFAGREGSTVDPQKWFLNTGRTGSGLTFSESTRNARLDGDGNLIITARNGDRTGLTTAQLVSRSMFRRDSGQVEARIRVPEDGDGLRPVFALFGAGRNSAAINLLADPVEDDEFHTYAVAWTPDSVTLSRDGDVVQRAAAPQNGTGQLFRLTLSLLITNPREADLPARMVVDSVDVDALDEEATPPAEETTPPAEATTPPAEATTPPAEVPTTPPATTPAEATTPPPAEPTTAPATTQPPAAAEVKQWKTFTSYKVGDVVKFKGKDYRVLEAHTSLPGWEPTTLVSLFKKL
ncbi:carbohydrate-binding protein [Actinoplanes sp. NPDC051346]|uniref:carbohydrate-binding protein n=1 Tax=Actinoplanes sp. NPDC051346 TaxID=3155048 RepID=UPI0034207712